jgi:phage/plasmid-like protein (TIGR03299 family)
MTNQESIPAPEPTVGVAAWNGIGAAIDAGTSFTDSKALCAALGLDWNVGTVPLVSQRTGLRIGKMREVVRLDTDETIGVVKQQYTPIQNHEQFGFLPQLCGEKGLQIKAGGILGGGARIWVLAKAGEQIFQDRILPNGEKDRIEHHLLFWNSHDGSTGQRIAALPYAFWCANALASAWRNAEQKWSIRHTRSAPQKLELALEQVTKALGWMESFGEEMIELEKERFNSQQMRSYVDALLNDVEGLITPKSAKELGTKANGEPRVDTQLEARKRRADKMVTLFEGEGAACRGATKLDAYQAITEFIDHHRRRARLGGDLARQQAARFEDTVFGHTAQRLRTRALARLRA